MATATVEVKSTGVELLGKQFNTVDKSLGRMGRTGARATAKIGAGLRRLQSSAAGLAAQFGLGLGLAALTRSVFTFDKALQQIQTDGKLTLKQITAFRTEILKLSTDTGQTKESVTAILDVFQAMGGITGKLNEKIGKTGTLFQFIAKTAKVTGADSRELASIVTKLISTLGLSPRGAADAVAALTAQANEGEIPLKNMARVLPELFGASAFLAQKGKAAALVMNQLLQTIGPEVGNNADKAKEAILAMIRDIRNATNKRGKLLGIQVLNKKGQIKNFNDTMRLLLMKTKGNVKKLSVIFKDASQKGLTAFIKQFDFTTGQFKAKQKGGPATLGSIARVGRAAKAADIDAARRRRALKGIAKEADLFDKAMRKIEAKLQDVGKEAIGFAAKSPALAAGAALAGGLVLKGIAGAAGGLLGKILGGAGGAAGGLAAKQAGITPVFVTNFPAGAGLAGAAGAAGGAGKAAAAGGALATAGAIAIGAAAAAAAGNMLGKLAATVVSGGAGESLFAMTAPPAIRKQIAALEAKQREKKFAGAIGGGGLLQTAQSLAAAGAAGGTTFGAAGGARKSLDAETIIKMLGQRASQQGQFGAFITQLPQIVLALSQIAKNPAQVIVKAGDGLSKIETQKSRGPKV